MATAKALNTYGGKDATAESWSQEQESEQTPIAQNSFL